MNKPKLRLGLCCISNNLRLNSKDNRFRTITRSSAQKLDGRALSDRLEEIYLHNVRAARAHIRYCIENDIQHYRLSSSLFPLVMLKRGLGFLETQDEVKEELKQAGLDARRNALTLSSHPGQFTVLPSDKPDTVKNAVDELNLHGWLHDALGMPRDHTNPINIHTSVSYLEPEEVRRRFDYGLERCKEGVAERLVLENEDKGTWNCDTLFKHFGDAYPLTFDNLHDLCNPGTKTPKENAKLFRTTWNRSGKRPVFHWSESIGPNKNGKLQRPHADFFSHVPEVVLDNPDVTWECEVKQKDLAIHKVKELL